MLEVKKEKMLTIWKSINEIYCINGLERKTIQPSQQTQERHTKFYR